MIVLLTTACTTSSQQVPGSVKFLEQDAKIRRQGVSYSTNVIHQNPKYPDQRAESSINVDFNPHKINQQVSRPITQNQQSALYQSYSNLHQQQQRQQQQQLRRPKSQQAFANSNNVPVLQRHPQFSSSENQQQQNLQIYNNVQKPPYTSPQSQSFNVGYSVSFTGGQKHQVPRTFSAQKLENAEIITGSRKEPVRKPVNNFETNDFVNNAFIDLKKQKVSGIKPKLSKFPSTRGENDGKSFIGNLAPKTQQYLSFLGDAKPIASSNIRFRQQLQSSNVQPIPNSQNVNSAWTSLSPSVEIYHSKELPQSHAFSVKEQLERSRHFDHAGALGKSQGFDYSNAVDAATEKNQLSSVQSPQEIVENTVTFEDNKIQTPPIPTYFDFTQNVQSTPLVIPYTNHFDRINVLPVGDFQTSQQSGETLDLKQIQPVNLSPSQLTIDMSLLRDPTLSLNGKNLPNDPHTVAIPFDTALLQAMQQKLLTSSQPIQSFDATKGQVQALQGNVGVTEQQYQGQVGNLQVQPLQGLKQDNFQDQGFKQFQGQQIQQAQQFNVYGSPHALFLKKDFDKYFDQQFDKMQPQESRYDNSVPLRPPPNNNSNNNKNKNNIRARSTKGKDIHMNLQPPPIIKITRHRRMFI